MQGSSTNIAQLPAVKSIIDQMIPVIQTLKGIHGIPDWSKVRSAVSKGEQAIMAVPGINKVEMTNTLYPA